MADEPFYKSHWRSIDPDRMSGYRNGFQWNEDAAMLYKLARISEGQVVADFGCGPGHVAVEFARRVGPKGHVHALDINKEFLELASENATQAGVSERISTHQNDGALLPFKDATLDRISARNTTMYVDNPVSTFCEFHRVLKPGGIAHSIDGDWYMIVAEPVGHDLWRDFIKAASHACRNADMGRKLYHSFSKAGFNDIEIAVRTLVDTEGRLMGMIRNLANYARESGNLSDNAIEDVVRTMETALDGGTYLVASSQFIVAGRKPS